MKKVIPTPFPVDPWLASATVLGEAVRSRRTQARMTIEDAALSIGVAKQTLSDLEAGKPGVSLGLALKIAAELGISLFVVASEQRDSTQRMLRKGKE